jgi:succinate dehydrogenase/fumarate reductase flavoprotein subunit
MTPNTAAHVRSVAALAEFRSALATYQSVTQDGLEALAMDIRRVQDWLADQRKIWEKAAREAYDEVVHAKAELTRRQTVPAGQRVPDTSQQEEDLRRAKAKLKFAEDKVAACRAWGPRFERALEEYAGPVRRYAGRIEFEIPKAVAALERIVQRLEAYLSSQAGGAS